MESEAKVPSSQLTPTRRRGAEVGTVRQKSRVEQRGLPRQQQVSCYLDMDGLLADLFDTVALRLHRKKYGETDLKERAVTRELWTKRDKFSGRVGDIEELFANLSPYPTNRELLDIVCERFGGFSICSHPAKLDPVACMRGKLRWIQNHIIPSHGKFLRGIHFPDRKEEFATCGGIPNLLVDDYSPYIDAWRKAGGVAIRIRADRFPAGDGFREFFLEELVKVGL